VKYVPGLMVGQLSGKAGNTVASRNKAGSFIRTRVIPKHVVNPLTTEIRANFGSNSQLYSTLTNAQRDAWSELGAQITKKTSLGETIHLTGLQALQSINRNLYSIGGIVAADAPAFSPPDSLQAVNINVAAGVTGSTTVTVGANSATQQVGSTADMFVGQTLFFATAAVYRTVDSITDATHVVLTTPVNSTTAEAIDFTGLPTVSIGAEPNTVPTDTYMLVEATAPLSPGISRPSRGSFRQLVYANPGDSMPIDAALAYVARFGQPPVGSKIFLRAKYISSLGFASPEIAAVTIVS